MGFGLEKDIFVVEFGGNRIPLLLLLLMLFDTAEDDGDGLFGDDAFGEGKCMINKSIHP